MRFSELKIGDEVYVTYAKQTAVITNPNGVNYDGDRIVEFEYMHGSLGWTKNPDQLQPVDKTFARESALYDWLSEEK